MVNNATLGNFVNTNRLEALVDGIFAIAMTLLVLTLAVPDIAEPLSNEAVINALQGLIPAFYVLILSFLLLAVFWSNHHRSFHMIKQMNTVLLWINVIWLLFIVMVPFSASLGGKYPQFPISHAIFNINMIGIAFFLTLNWWYARRNNFIDEKADPKQLTVIWRTDLLFIVIAILALALSLIIPRWSQLIYLLIFPLEYLIGKL